MASASGGGVASPPDTVAFSALVASLPKALKKLDEILAVPVQRSSKHRALKLVENGLVGQFTGIWPSPKSMAL
jgi:hypothetical protein